MYSGKKWCHLSLPGTAGFGVGGESSLALLLLAAQKASLCRVLTTPLAPASCCGSAVIRFYGEDANSGAVVTCLLSLGSLGADSGPCLLCPEGALYFPSYPAVGAETQQEARIPPSPLGASRCLDDRKSILDPQPCTGGGVVERKASFGVYPSRCPALIRVYL